MEEVLAELKPAATVSAHHVSWQDTMNKVCCESLSILGGLSIELSFFLLFFVLFLFQHSLSHKHIAVYKNRNVVEPLLWGKKTEVGFNSIFYFCFYTLLLWQLRPEMPKAPLTAYMLYSKLMRPKFKEKYPELSHGQLAVKIGE